MSTDHKTTFTADDLLAIVAAQDQIAKFRSFLLDRFIAWTQSGDKVDVRGRVITPVADLTGKTSSGWGQWRLASTSFATDAQAFRFEHWLADDRGPSTNTAIAVVPATFIFAAFDEQADYEQFLALKARFEPTA